MPILTFLEYCEEYDKLKKQGKLQEAKDLLNRYRAQVHAKMVAAAAEQRLPKSRYERTEVL